MTRRPLERIVETVCAAAAWLCVTGFAVVICTVIYVGVSKLELAQPDVLSSLRRASLGSLSLVALATSVTIPIGIGAGIYLEEFCRPGVWRIILRANVGSSLGIPPLLYGLLGCVLFGRWLVRGNPSSMIAAALVLAFIMLPMVAWSTQSALRKVPRSFRRASYALGATRWQTVYRQVLPSAWPGIGRGALAATARALGEAAPVLLLFAWMRWKGAAADDIAVLPVEAYRSLTLTDSNPTLAVACIIVLMAILMGIAVTKFFMGQLAQDDSSMRP